MDYIKTSFKFKTVKDWEKDILIEELGDLGFESFEIDENGFNGYCPVNYFNIDKINNTINILGLRNNTQIYTERIKDKNWNKYWERESNTPIKIGNKCIIYATKNNLITEDAQYKIIIDPKMSFGTGHHQTTRLMAEEILNLNLNEKRMVDMGCGTAVLAILGKMKGAKYVEGIDIDQWAYNNANENIIKNNTKDIKITLGGAEKLKGKIFDYVFANINRNILLKDMDSYYNSLKKGGELFVSGFYRSDVKLLNNKAKLLGMEMIYEKHNNEWTMIRFKKN